MREPIPIEVEFEWWRATLAGYPQPINSIPQPGYFKRRLAKGGVFVPAKIWFDQSTGDDGELIDQPILRCEVNGVAADPVDEWLSLAAHPIRKSEFDYLTARGDWATWFSPDDFAARPRQPIDHLKTPILF